eukprot:gene17067-20331_t
MSSRIGNDLADWAGTERHYRKMFGDDIVHSKEFKKMKLAHFEVMELKYKGIASPMEQGALRIIREKRREQEQLLYPNLFTRMLYRAAKSLLDSSRAVEQHKAIEIQSNDLREQLEAKGLGHIISQVDQQISQGNRDISIPVTFYVSEGERMDYKVELKRNTSGGYDLEDIKARLNSEKPGPHKGEISLLKNNLEDITLHQAYNLLAGRSVQVKDTWLQLDFNDKDATGNFRTKVFPPGFGFDVEQLLSDRKLKELKDPWEKQKIVDALKNGDPVKATEVGQPKEVTLEANAHRKSLGEKNPDREQAQGKGARVIAFQPKQKMDKPGIKKIEDDPFVRTGHLAVFSALFFMALANGERGTVRATSWEVMAVAKISSQITYLQIIADLDQFGYVEYRPSLSKFHHSEIKLLRTIFTDQLVLKSDLEDFKVQLLSELKTLLKEVIGVKPKKWMKSVEVKRLLKISHGKLQTMRNAGTITYMKIGGTIYYDEDDIEKMNIPPDEKHVLVYFNQKGSSEEDALGFYLHYSLKNWRNREGVQIKNWKVHAWEWIWGLSSSANRKAQN